MAGLLDFGSLMGDDPLKTQLFNLGIGLLAGNQEGNIGRGALFGFQNGQQAIRQNQLLKQQAEDQAMQREMYNWKKQDWDATQAAIAEASAKNPEFAAAFRLNPAAAIRAAYPQVSGADPYFSPYDAANGSLVFNHRDGKYYTPDGKLFTGPIVKAANSPELRGAVKGAEARATADYKPNEMIDGQIFTDTQVADMARGLPTNNFSTPYPVTFGAPGTTATDVREGTTTNQAVAVRNPAGGIRTKTAAQIESEKAQAKADIEVATAGKKIKAEDQAKSEINYGQVAAQADEALRLVDELVKHPGFEAAVGASSKFDPRNYLPGTDATGFNVRLDQIKGKQFLQAFESLKGGGQITEVEGKKATEAIARMNTAVSETEFKQAAEDFKNVIKAGAERARAKVGKVSSMSSGGWSAKRK